MDTIPASKVGEPIGTLYGGISSAHRTETAQRWRERAILFCADAECELVSSGTRVGAAFDACACALLSHLAQRGLIFAAAQEVVERLVACMLGPHDQRFVGVRRVVDQHLLRYEAPPEFGAQDVAVVLEVARYLMDWLPQPFEVTAKGPGKEADELGVARPVEYGLNGTEHGPSVAAERSGPNAATRVAIEAAKEGQVTVTHLEDL